MSPVLAARATEYVANDVHSFYVCHTVIQEEDVATISVRVEDDLKEVVEEAAAAVGRSTSEWTRDVIRTQLGFDVTDRDVPRSLPKRDRRILALLHQLLESAAGDEYEAGYHHRMAEVLEHGFTIEYTDAFMAVDDELPVEECLLLFDIFDMFTALERSVESVGLDAVRALDEHAEHALRFRGFDFNDRREGRLATFAKYVISTDRWTNMAVYFDPGHGHGNSHSPVLASYLRMLAVFKPIWRSLIDGAGRGGRYELNESELGEIMKAWPYPS